MTPDTAPPVDTDTVPAGDSAAALETHDVPEPVMAMLRSPFDPVLSDPVRLRLQAALNGLPGGGSMSFTALRKTLELSDGNLGAHLAILVDHEYAATSATYRGRRRTTRYAATARGRAAFEAHVSALQSVIDAARAGQGRTDPDF